jgi:hypothetical protein
MAGTANTLDPITTQVGIFAEACAGRDLSRYSSTDSEQLDAACGPFKIAFDGCGVTDGTLGTLFAAGLEGQCDLVCGIVRDLWLAAAGTRRVRVNCLGLSRGGLALMILAQKVTAAWGVLCVYVYYHSVLQMFTTPSDFAVKRFIFLTSVHR